MDEWEDYDWGIDDDYHDWHYKPSDRLRDDARARCEDNMDAWDEDDEPRYLAALLAAGAEPVNEYDDAHLRWQDRAAQVLMQKYAKHWWMDDKVHAHGDPRYRQKARTCRSSVQIDELTKWYAWVCKQRGEEWTFRTGPR